jgi:hypothetical protein
MLKTAGGYLLVLQTFDQEGTGSEQCVRLMQIAKEKGDWDLCKELARFLLALDQSGNELRKALEKMGINIPGSSPSGASTAAQEEAENDKDIERGSRSKTPEANSNGVPKGYRPRNANDEDGISPGHKANEGLGLGIHSDGDPQEDYFSRRQDV